MPTVHLAIDTNDTDIPSSQQFQSWVDAVFNALPPSTEKASLDVCITVVSTEQMTHLNESFRKKSGATNVLSFVYDAMPGIPDDSFGDIVLCAQVIKNEALAQQKTLTTHFAHLTIHGLLHLLGYDHIETHEAEIMESLEIKIMQRLGFNNPYE